MRVILGLENKWGVIVNSEVIGKGEEIENMLKQVRQEYPDEIPFMAKVADERIIIL